MRILFRSDWFMKGYIAMVPTLKLVNLWSFENASNPQQHYKVCVIDLLCIVHCNIKVLMTFTIDYNVDF